MYLLARLQTGIAPLGKLVYYESWFLRGITTFPVTGRIRLWLPMWKTNYVNASHMTSKQIFDHDLFTYWHNAAEGLQH